MGILQSRISNNSIRTTKLFKYGIFKYKQILEDPMEVLLCECVNDLHYSLFHFLNCLIMTAYELRE